MVYHLPSAKSQASTTRVELRLQLDAFKPDFEPVGQRVETTIESRDRIGCNLVEMRRDGASDGSAGAEEGGIVFLLQWFGPFRPSLAHTLRGSGSGLSGGSWYFGLGKGTRGGKERGGEQEEEDEAGDGRWKTRDHRSGSGGKCGKVVKSWCRRVLEDD